MSWVQQQISDQNLQTHKHDFLILVLQVVEQLDNVKQIEVKPNGRAEFSMEMKLWDPNSTINLYKVS